MKDIKSFILKSTYLTVPFGWIDLLPLPYTSLTFVLLYCYFAVCALELSRSISKKAFLNYGIFLFIMWVIMLLKTLYDGGYDVADSRSQIRQILFFSTFYVLAVPKACHMALRDVRLDQYFLVAVIGMMVAYFAGFSYTHEASGRTTLYGLNPNVVGLYAASACILLLDVLVRKRRAAVRYGGTKGIITLMIFLLVVLSKTGSRGGLIIFAVAVSIYFLGGKGLSRRQFVLILISAAILVGAIWVVASTGPVAERLGDIDKDARLEIIWPAAIEIVKNHPVFGVGFDRSVILMSQSIGMKIAHHNEYLKIATASGLIGLALFSAVLFNLLRKAIHYRNATGSAVRLSMFVIVVLQLGKGGGALGLSFIWLMFLLLSTPPSPSDYFNLRGRGQARGAMKAGAGISSVPLTPA